MTRRRVAIIVVVGLVAVVVAGAAILLVRDAGEDESTLRPFRARATLSDRIVVFGDTVRAQVDLAVDLRHVDPGTVKVRAAFAPWRRVGPVRVTRTDAGSSSHIRMTYVLRCLKQACVPERDTLPFEFKPARVEFVNRTGGRGALRASFPRVTVHTRISPGDLATAAPWRLDVTNVPEPSYRTSPALLLALLIGGSLVLFAGGGVLAFVGWPRRHVEPELEPEPEPELMPTPLEQALELLEDAARANGAADQRRSLELVAEVLGERGEEDGLAEAARALAWSPTAPGPDKTKSLAARVRAALEEELRALEEERRREEDERRRRAEEARARTD
ncbi:MAG TPA: hypothetical protein VNI55_06185 [Gaiellaceae bacterium]|nr:hypothetical protein [Gaiellaceae bacterium]